MTLNSYFDNIVSTLDSRKNIYITEKEPADMKPAIVKAIIKL